MQKQQIIDGHIHVFGKGTQGVKDMLAMMHNYGYGCCNFLSCECMGDLAQNALGIYLKALAPENYIFGGLQYRAPQAFGDEVETLAAMGFDGMKMVENKPTLRKELNMPANDARYKDFYGWMERNNFPLLAHIADPEELWDDARVPQWAAERGWAYTDGTFVPKETLVGEMIDVLDSYPHMKVILAHFFFMSAELERIDELLATHPNVCVDITAGSEMYFNFMQRRDDWREFFLKYQDRIIFGTDNMNLYEAEDIENSDITNRMELAFLNDEGEIPVWDKHCLGIALPEDVQHKILRTNFQRVVSEAPRPLDKPLAARYLKKRLDTPALQLTGEEKDIITEVLDYIG